MLNRRRYVVILGALLSSPLCADQFHYNNVLMGDRAAGMGGAFTAVADDASGVHYNPAGLAFALSNDISGSANAIYQKKVTYKKAAFGKDFVEKSGGTLAPFFGALGKLDHISPGLVFGFGYMTLDSDLKDQDDTVYGGDSNVIEAFGYDPVRLHRTANVRANTNKFGVAFAKRWGGNFAAGFGLNYMWVDELTQIYQDSTSLATVTQEVDGEPEVTELYLRSLAQNVRERLQINAIEPTLGFQFAFASSFSLGLTIKKPMIIYQRYESKFDRTISFYDVKNKKVVDVNDTGLENKKAYPYREINEPGTQKNAISDLPMEVRLGGAWFASTKLLLTGDIIHHTESSAKVAQYKRDAVTDLAAGLEWYMTPSFPLRLGAFTNNDARPKPKSSKVNQEDSIDYVGGSVFFAFVQPNSQIALGTVLQQGSGKAQKIAGSSETQKVKAFAWNAGFSVSHNF